MTPSNAQLFRELHHHAEPLLLPNAWDARSAATYQELDFRAVGTSSAAIAGMLGYADGEQMPFADLRFVVARICQAVQVPVTVDVEAGYSRDATQVCANVAQLAELGVVGINIEDSVVSNGHRQLVPAAVFAELLYQLKSYLAARGLEVFINARTDTYLLGTAQPLAETSQRAQAYEQAGADGLFVPGLTDLGEMRQLAASTALPLNVMCLPNLPDFGELQQAGVRRISMGNFAFEHLGRVHAQAMATLRSEQNFATLFR
ncbi:isocitrate lyase/PEP mutase family protein [Hymenobacter latericus]|uniref:isocitrate lyase/PEP mutase family protein n=1 Tax=Hymenobacter sp. YIM 151858-1 TaxID=2987688 RepID=UPI002227E661|nr:isocitrate lyase/phosphoenolpyruvate mutase family protein [Hymenobacter sp. YIM 151858-1]UYZ59733.1 isocitrate lyase/phosphoenolpyruvate mutase family protein [Hymenobacter sp. YIM 151858-1]